MENGEVHANFTLLGRSAEKKEVQLGNPETIRENQAIPANLRIDSRESGHLSGPFWSGVRNWVRKKTGENTWAPA